MKLHRRYLLAVVLASALAGCGSSDDGEDAPSDDPPGAGSGGAPGDGEDPGGGTTDGTTAGDADGGGSPPSAPSATGPLPTPSLDDFFFVDLESDTETPAPGGPPTQPKNLRIDLVSNDWAEFSWAPSNDDGAVVQYNIYRSDQSEPLYRVRGDDLETYAEELPSSSLRALERFWRTTSFVDCNYTRFTGRPPHQCQLNGPSPGDTFGYHVTAVDEQGNESAASNAITIEYPALEGATVPEYVDPYMSQPPFARTRDLSSTASFLGEFSLVFEDDFDGDGVDPRRWNTELLWGDDFIINGEEQYFVDAQSADAPAYDPFRVESSTLTIEAVPTPAALADDLPEICQDSWEDGRERCAFLSGALATHDKFRMLYGYVEARMKPSTTPGALTSFYLFHRYPGEGRGFHAPEIDIFEGIAANRFNDERNGTTFNYHFGDTATFARDGEELIRRSPTMYHEDPDGEGDYADGEYHTYGVLWEPQLVVWYVDGKEVRRLFGPQVSRQPMNIVLYLVTGSGWAVTPELGDPDLFPIELEVDYIRAYQRGGYVGNGLYPSSD